MPEGRKIAFSATNPFGDKVVAFQQTLDQHRLKHQEPFSDEEIIDCIESPHIIAETGHEELKHKKRMLYYKDKNWDDGGPDMMKVIAEHGKDPAVLTSAFRTSKFTNDGQIVYIDKDYYGGRLS